MRTPNSMSVPRCLFVGSLLLLLASVCNQDAGTTSTALGDDKTKKTSDSPAQPPSVFDVVGRSQPAAHRGPECMAVDDFFTDEVWAKVGERTCLKCHNADGDASDSEFLLRDADRDRSGTGEAHRHNRAAFQRMASALEDGKSRLLLKSVGGLDHGGKKALDPDSTAHRILTRFVRRTSGKPDDTPKIAEYDAPPFFDGIEFVSPQGLLRRVTLSLAARLPTDEERAAVDRDGLKVIDAVLDGVLREDAFYERLQEAFNDILLVRGYDGGAEGALSYEHFKTRLWYQKHDLSHAGDEDAQRKARYKLAGDYREAMLREPLELIAHIVRNERPFTEIVTADYIMVSPYTSRGYGIYEELRETFKDPDDPFEYVPVRIKSLKHRNGRNHQESPTGFYPHAGLLSTFQYLKRYPTSETNRNRLRVRMYFQHFLGVDIMQLAPRSNDAATITAQYEIPTMQATDCVVCHKVIDPVAGLFQDYYVVDGKGIYGPRKEGWFKDIFPAGLEHEGLPADQRWRSLQWLGERTAKDPRFAVAMVEHVWYILAGRKPLLPPEDIDDPLFSPKRRAYREQRALIEDVARRFAQADFNLKVVFKELVQSDFYRVDGLATAAKHPRRRAELDDVGLVRLLTPEQLERKLTVLFGQKWGRLVNRESRFKILYGGIDSKAVTERVTDPSGAMGAIQRIMSNDVACKNVALDFTTPLSQRRLFPNIEPTVLPGGTPEDEAQIRAAIVHLHQYLLGREHPSDHPEVDRTYELFAGIISDAKSAKGIDKRGSYSCERIDGKRLDDPHYTLRAWRGVVTYLLRQHDFLYE